MIALLALFASTFAHADCETFFRGFHVDSLNYGNNPAEAVYAQISSDDLGQWGTIAAYYAQCTTPECKKNLDILSEAFYSRELIKLGVAPEICSNLSQYMMMKYAGGSVDMIPIESILFVEADPNYPF